MKKSAPIVIAGIILACTACAHSGPRHLNIWPLVYYHEDTVDQTTTLSVLTPIIYYHRGKEGHEFSVRPIFSIARDDAADSTVVDILYPLIKYKKYGADENFRVFPIIRDTKADIAPDKTRIAHDYFPLYWGRSEDGKAYGGLFPVYGTVKDRFGKDDVLFLLWPVYSRTEEDAMTSHTVLWPVFRITTGDQGWGMRVFPIWGHDEITGKSYRTFFLFPLATFQGRYLDTDAPMKDMYFIPFYVSRTTPYSRSTSVLWPFFTVSTNEHTNYLKISAPWPLISYARSDTLSLFQFAPFYRKRVTTDKDTVDESSYILYPLYSWGRTTSPSETEETYRFLLIDKYERTTFSDGSDELQVYLFPLYDRSKTKTGEDATTVLYPLPLRDDGFRRNYLPLFEIYKHEIAADGTDRLTILHHLLVREQKDGVETIDVPFYFHQQPR
jgi:hypothetical protein